MLMSPSKLFLFSKEVHLNSGVRLLLELYCVVVTKDVAFFTIWVKLTAAFGCTSLPLNLYTSVLGCCCGFGLEQKFWRIGGLVEKEARIGGFAYPYSAPLYLKWDYFVASLMIRNSETRLLRVSLKVSTTKHQFF